ncbi:MAG: carboxypeptidase-like regulatory domain-containing protein, partial [Planctomycetota bacterium]
MGQGCLCIAYALSVVGCSAGSAWTQPMPVAPPLVAPSLSGTLRDGAGAPVAQVRVTLFTTDLAAFSEVRTDAAGRYRILAGPLGALRLGVAAPGFAYQELGIQRGGGAMVRDFTLLPETHTGRWEVIGSTAGEFFDASDIGILLADGRVMYCHDTLTPVIFNPVTGQAFPGASSGLGQGCMNITLLADGRPIFVGGQPGSDPGQFRNAVRYVKAYNPVLNSWQRFADLLNPTGRWYPGMVRLADGSLMAMGGGTRPDAVRTATCERLNLATMTWTYTGSMINASEFTPAALLPPSVAGSVLGWWTGDAVAQQLVPVPAFGARRGYWVYALSDLPTVTLSGQPITDAGLYAYAGWNLVGPAVTCTVPLDNDGK